MTTTTQAHHHQSPGQPGRLPFTIVIQTCYSYAEVAVPVLLASLAQAGVPRESLLVVCGQCPPAAGGGGGTCRPPRIPGAEGLRVAAVSYTAEALTGLIHLSETPPPAPDPLLDPDSSPPTGWVLYLQDTMAAGPDFLRRALEVHRQVLDTPSTSESSVHCVKLLNGFSMSVGFYDLAWLRGLDLGALKAEAADTDRVREIKTWCEDKVFDMCPAASARFLAEFNNPEDRRVLGAFRYSDSSAARKIEHYPVLDLYKFKSWDGDEARVGTYRAADGTERVAIPVGV